MRTLPSPYSGIKDLPVSQDALQKILADNNTYTKEQYRADQQRYIQLKNTGIKGHDLFNTRSPSKTGFGSQTSLKGMSPSVFQRPKAFSGPVSANVTNNKIPIRGNGYTQHNDSYKWKVPSYAAI